ncbi:hypothetical protein NE865_08902 [Phthorimaea operculella]|nr:hypothetical protein NE865_08902 [Phthorimaea operculella]
MGRRPKKKKDDEVHTRSRSRSPVAKELTTSSSDDSSPEDMVVDKKVVDNNKKRTFEDKKSERNVNQDQYKVFKVDSYNRKYPEDCNKSEYIVFVTHNEKDKPFSDRERMLLSEKIYSNGISGVLHFRSVNRFKISIMFNSAKNANAFIQNKKILDELSVSASIPAADTEVTGVIRSVPAEMSNKEIFVNLGGSSKNIVQVRRFMRRVRGDGGEVSFQPTQTVAVTFSSTQLPEFVYLHYWRHEVSQYVPPVKQCLRCLKFGHIASYCKNGDACSICSGPHNFKICNSDKNKPTCANCKGDHVAISTVCPIKKAKIEENKIKSHSATYSDLFDEKSFPHLAARNSNQYLQNMIKSQSFINMVTQVIVKLIANKKNEAPINTETIRAAFQDTISERVHSTN